VITNLWRAACAIIAAVNIACARSVSSTPAPSLNAAQATADELFAADQAFAAASARVDLVMGLSRMFGPDIVMPGPGGKLARGRDEAVALLQSNPANAQSRAQWTPIRVGVSGDGQHGFTFGYMTITRADSTQALAKYVAYWIKQADGWRVSAYKRAGRPAGAVSSTPLAPALPQRVSSVVHDSSVLRRFARELDDAERAFSRDAQGGISDAFRRYASADANHMGGPTDASFRSGPDEIAAGLGPSQPGGPSLTWEPSEVRVASSGDVGITIGYITIKPAAGSAANSQSPPPQPYFTIWHRSGPAAPWRFIIE
jgi:ketosteroid isomerase-like protein